MLPRARKPAVSLLALAFALAWPHLGRAQVVPPIIDPPAWNLSPEKVPADSAFQLSVLSYQFTCATAFSHLQVGLQDGRLDLSFTAEARKGIMCPMIYRPYGPTFKVPPLKAGSYAVYVANQPACIYSQPACLIRVAPEYAGTLTVGPSGISYFISPKQAEPGQDFDLGLFSYQWNCATTFSNTNATVDGGAITLSFLEKDDPQASCPAVYKPYGFSVPVKGLPAGVYKVLAQRLPGCMGCMPIRPQFVDTFSVQPTALPKDRWFIKPNAVPAGQPFALQFLNNAYGNCQTSFDHLNLSAGDGQIVASFSIESHPERVCITDIRPFGPTFKVDSLKPGVYPVLLAVKPACLFSVPACKILEPAPRVVDTLVVKGDPQPQDGWMVEPKMVKANTPFTLKLTNWKYGSCGTEFANPNLSVDGYQITASFDVVLHPERVCITNVSPYGPSFEMPGLKEGRYTLVVKETVSDCPPGMVCIDPPKKVLSQAMEFEIGSSTALAALQGASQPYLRTDRNGLSFRLPGAGQAPVRAEVFTPNGQRLASRLIAGNGMGERFLDLGGQLQPGLYLVKLSAPGTAPLVRPFAWHTALNP